MALYGITYMALHGITWHYVAIYATAKALIQELCSTLFMAGQLRRIAMEVMMLAIFESFAPFAPESRGGPDLVLIASGIVPESASATKAAGDLLERIGFENAEWRLPCGPASCDYFGAFLEIPDRVGETPHFPDPGHGKHAAAIEVLRLCKDADSRPNVFLDGLRATQEASGDA
jgi:hypothetical protein